LSAYFYSTVSLLAGSIHLYYDTSAMLITLVLLGKTLESRAKNRVLEGLDNLLSLKPTKVRICTDQYPEGRFVAAEQLAAGDIVRVDENEIVAADGRISSGTGSVDESSLTGEPLPVGKKPGDNLRSGTRIIKGSLRYKAKKTGGDSTLGQMMAIIEKTLLAKTPLEGRTDVILQWFVPVILAMAAGTALVCRLNGLSTAESMLRAVTVMVISCPCALGIAIPLARVAGISIAGKKGILVRDFSAFERAARIDTFVFDKTFKGGCSDIRPNPHPGHRPGRRSGKGIRTFHCAGDPAVRQREQYPARTGRKYPYGRERVDRSVPGW
jgi:P-type E1-E2 ATPase